MNSSLSAWLLVAASVIAEVVGTVKTLGLVCVLGGVVMLNLGRQR